MIITDKYVIIAENAIIEEETLNNHPPSRGQIFEISHCNIL